MTYMPARSPSGRITVGLLMLGAAACGGGGGSRDINRPSVSAVSPAVDSASAVITANISATFDRAMDANTINATTFVVTGPSGDLAGAVSYDTATDTAIFEPARELEIGQSYTASIARTVRDTLSRTLDAAFIWRFRTGGRIVRVSVNADGVEADGCSFEPLLSENGGIIIFESLASNLVDGDAADLPDVIRKDSQTEDLMLVTADEDGTPADSAASTSPPCSPTTGNNQFPTQFNADLSSDGRYVAFQSDDPDLIAGGGNGFTQVFVKDTQTGAVTLVSATATGLQGNGDSSNPSISNDGRFVVFDSAANNLLDAGIGNDSNGERDVFRKDLETGVIELVSLAGDGVTQGNGESIQPDISADGSVVVFESLANNLLGVAGDINSRRDIYRRNIDTETTLLVSVAADGQQANEDSFAPSVTADGLLVAFHSRATNLSEILPFGGNSQVFLKDMAPAFRTVTLVSVAEDASTQGNGDSQRASISADGRFVAFDSQADNLVPGDTLGVNDVFVKFVGSEEIIRVSVAEDGLTQGNAASMNAAISTDGRYVGFESEASNLVLNDSNGLRDIFRALNDLF